MRWVLVLIVTAVGCTPDSDPPLVETGPYLSAAERAGTWLQSHQIEALGSPDRTGVAEVSSGLGSGAAGRAVFFGELYSATAREGFLRSARLEAQSAIAELSETPSNLSLYGGLVGVAFAVAEVAALANDSALTVQARRQFDEVVAFSPDRGGVGWGDVNDVLGGAAGIGLGLLYAYDRFNDASYLEVATEVGDALLMAADSVGEGQLRWMRGEAQPFDLPNFSHGTAGVGFFLTQLGSISGLDRFVTAGSEAVAYIDAVGQTVDGALLVPYGVPNDGYVTPFDIGWAHGPAGTARLHHAAWLAHSDETMKERVEAGARAILASGVPGPSADTTLWRGPFRIDRRFGTAGAASFLFDAGRATGQQSFLDRGFEIADALIARASSTSSGLYWTLPLYGFQGGPGEATFTGYFYGSAGVGLALLHAHYAAAGRSPRIRLPDDPFGSGP